MIKSLEILNFQSHKKSNLEFSDGVNIVLGQSDSGKTAIIRALRWLMFNKPSGDEMKSNWGGDTSVSLHTSDQYFCRNKTKNGNEYILDGLSFKAFGTEVPTEIVKGLNINSINIQNQLDSPFLLSETPGQVASHFNTVAHLQKIDTGLQNINSAIRELTSNIKYAEGQEKSLIEGLSKFEYLDKFEIDVEVLEGMEKRFVKTYTNFDKLGKLLKTYQTNGETILEYKELLELEEPLNKIFEWKKQKRVQEINLEVLKRFTLDISQIKEEIVFQNNLTSLEIPVNTLLKLYKEKETAENLYNSLCKAIKRLENIKSQLISANALHLSLQAKFEKAMPEGSICPLCNQKIKK